MENKEIHELIRLISKSNLAEFKMRQGDFELTIRTSAFGKGRVETVPQILAPATPVVMPATVAPAVAAPAAAQAPAAAVAPPAAPSADSAASNEGLIEIKSPMVGTFYRSGGPDKPAFVQVGDSIKPGVVVCIIEAMKLFNEIESEVTGKIVKVLVNDANPVEYDQPLFLVDPKG